MSPISRIPLLAIAPEELARVHRFLRNNGGERFNLGRRYSIEEHMQHISSFASHLTPLIQPQHHHSDHQRWLDLGAGSGILGFLCAFAFPQIQITLLDNRESCAEFLSLGVKELDLSNRVQVLHARAEAIGRQGSSYRHGFDGIVARRFSGGPAIVAECSAPLLTKGSFILVSDPKPVSGDVKTFRSTRWPADGLSSLGLKVEEHLDHATVLRSFELCNEKYPRSRRLKHRLWG